MEIKRLFKIVKLNPLRATRLDIREYLKDFIGKPANTYANILKALMVFYRDYLGRKDVIEEFKFPSRPFNVISVPSREDDTVKLAGIRLVKL